ncbi:hypothetical protein ACWCPY_42675, partial [Streptomyces sp. NPDC002403]
AEEHHEQTQRLLMDLSLQAPPPIPADISPPTGAMGPPADPHAPAPTGPPAPANQAGPGQTHQPTPPPSLTIEDIARTIRQLAAQHGRGVGGGVHLDALAAHLSRTQAEIRDVLTANGITVKPVQLQFGNERRQRVGVRVGDLGGHGLAHLPTVEDLARTIRQLAAADNRHGVHLEALTTHLRGLSEFQHLDLQKYEIRSVLQAAGISVRQFTGLDGDMRRQRVGVRVGDLGGHGLAQIPTVEDLARTIRELSAANHHLGVHLADLSTHLRGLQVFEIRGVLAAAGITVKSLHLSFGDERRFRLGVRVNDLGQHGLAGNGAGELRPGASDEPGRTGPEETMDQVRSPGRAHGPASPH